MPLSEIARDLQSQISHAIHIETDARGQHYIATPFTFGDGDQPVVALTPNQDGWMLSDQGTTLFRLGFQLNDAEYSNPENQRRLDSALAMAGISQHDGQLTKPLPPGQYADAVFNFVHALLKIDELGDFPATRGALGPFLHTPQDLKSDRYMRFNHWNLGPRDSGDVVVVNLSDKDANVRLLDNPNFQSYQAGRRYRYYGGIITHSPYEIPIPHDGTWHVVADRPAQDGQPDIDIQMVPRAARLPLPRYQQPSLVPIAQALAQTTPELPAHHGNAAPPARTHDVFISHSHAADDLVEVVHPLTKALHQQGLSVWHADVTFDTAKRLPDITDAGIAQSRFGIVVLSEHFFTSQWNWYELDHIVATHSTGKQDLLPILHKLTKEQVVARRPQLADAIARSTTESTIEEIAAEIAEAIYDQKQPVAAG